MKIKNFLKFNKNNHRSGFTFIEIVVALFAFTILVYGSVTLFYQIIVYGGKQTSLLANSDQARKVIFQITDEFRRSQRGSDGSYNILSGYVDGQQLTFFSNYDNQPDIERVRYFTQGGKLKKGVTKFNGTIYDLTKESVSIVLDNVANGSDAVFSYYDGTYNGSGTALSSPIQVTSVKYIKVTLKIFNKGGKTGTNTYTVTGGAAVRDLKTNLGS